jgi:hypothetical protein
MLNRREFLSLSAASLSQPPPAPSPIPEPHFPNRICQFVWRNWELANIDRMAEVVAARPRQLLRLGAAMGLPPKPQLTADQLRRIYVTVIRQNWHLLPLEQLTALLGWSPERLAFTLKEDDFLDHKLGPKPACPPLRYTPPTAPEKKAMRHLRELVHRHFGQALFHQGEPPFAFVHQLSSQHYPALRSPQATPQPGEIDLSHGWRLLPSTNPRLQRAGERFARYLSETFAARLDGARPILLALTPAIQGSRVTVSDDQLLIEATSIAELIEALYHLQDRLEQREGPFLAKGSTHRQTVWSPRYLYSYFALYGDPLIEPEADPFPNGYLEKLARAGINGVWLQAVLNTLAPSAAFPEFGAGSQKRLAALRRLVERAAEYGVKVYLYLNEPRAMPPAFFEKYPHLRGSRFQDVYAMCTSVPVVRQWIRDSLAHVFHHVPDLGGVFTISMSENHTNCFSHGGAWRVEPPSAGDCPRCSKRTSWDTLAELFLAIDDGIRASSKTAEIIHYDWGWPDQLTPRLIEKLPPGTRIVSISEWSVPVQRGGVNTTVGEYSISVVGPGPRALRTWNLARQAGLTSLAKVQLNNTWEISAVPYIPVPHLIAAHCANLRQAGISGLMAAWTCGGYPSPNLDVAKAFYFDPPPNPQSAIASVARQRFGAAAAQLVIQAWERFSQAFREFPYGVAIYILPLQHGPANLLRHQPTGHKPGMILFPHDALRDWCGRYPPEVVQSQLQKLASQWQAGLPLLEQAVTLTSPARRRHAQMELAMALTCYHHFQSVAHQVEFYRLREAGFPDKQRLRELVSAEISLARQQFALARQWSVIAYEASNHYYYRPLDLVEKVLNCQNLLEELQL